MLHLLLGTHNHQPVGNFEHVLDKAYKKAYLPFLRILERHPGVRLSMHHSGILYEWLESAHPDYLDRLAGLIRAGQVEAIGGGFYEPVLALLPERDQRGQLLRMQGYLKTRFGAPAQGAWLTERVWEPSIPSSLSKAGIRYTIVDDAHFLSVGFSPAQLTGYFLTESDGRDIGVFPISQKLRYMIPFSPPEEVVAFLRSKEEASGGGEIAIAMADDGEKFGLWPQTHRTVYEEGWLERFFSLLEENAAWLRCTLFSEYRLSHPPLGLAYLPTMSYAELSEWAMDAGSGRELELLRKATPEAGRCFVRGGYFRNFLSKYPEGNRMYRKMLRVSTKVGARGRVSAGRREAARKHLWQAQCNCAYWHGVFGGLYLPHLRNAVYAHLIEAERLAETGVSWGGGFRVSREDWDADGEPELLIESGQANWYVSPARGAGLWEWDIKALGVNLCNVVSRRPEAYHGKLRQAQVAEVSGHGGKAATIHGLALAKEPGLDGLLFYDWHGRMSLLDHFLHPDTGPEDFAASHYGEQGDFVLGRYAARPARRAGGRLALTFDREGAVWAGKTVHAIRIEKTLSLDPDGSWRCDYVLRNGSPLGLEAWFGVEIVAAFSSPGVCGARNESEMTQTTFSDPHLGLDVHLRLDRPCGLWAFPLYTVSQSEEGFEKTYQGSVLLLHRKFSLGPGQAHRLVVGMEVKGS